MHSKQLRKEEIDEIALQQFRSIHRLIPNSNMVAKISLVQKAVLLPGRKVKTWQRKGQKNGGGRERKVEIWLDDLHGRSK